jgi:glucose-6-phosphate 1-dehydrogenase
MSPSSEHPTVLILLGATGNLAETKIYPALLDLSVAGLLPSEFRIISFARKQLSDTEYRGIVNRWLHSARPDAQVAHIERILAGIHYVRGDFDDDASYARLSSALADFDATVFAGRCSNKLFYLAIPPALYENVLTRIARSGLSIPCLDKSGWTRVLIEKPFGNDVATAHALDTLLGKLFEEDQIFRIDHYLAKETLQNILAFRFGNALFEPLWNHEHIDRIDIILSEAKTIGSRGALYEGLGALKDVGQNHALQMLALVAMEQPSSLESIAVRAERTRVLDALVVYQQPVRGQYKGYKKEENVSGDSMTETAFAFRAHVNTPRWKNVLFTVASGKGFSESKAEIRVHFKRPTVCMWGTDSCARGNELTFRIQPKEGIALSFLVKRPGFSGELEERHLAFSYGDGAGFARLPDAYERVLFDCIKGDQTLFASTREVDVSWRFIEEVVKSWSTIPMGSYEQKSDIEKWLQEVFDQGE